MTHRKLVAYTSAEYTKGTDNEIVINITIGKVFEPEDDDRDYVMFYWGDDVMVAFPVADLKNAIADIESPAKQGKKVC